MTSDTDDLEQQLRQNLELRRELGAEVARARGASEGGGIAYRLGWVLYWASLALALSWVAFLIWLLMDPSFVEDIRSSPYLGVVMALPALVAYGLGRAFRYVLSGE
jgi:hypothetical protein